MRLAAALVLGIGCLALRPAPAPASPLEFEATLAVALPTFGERVVASGTGVATLGPGAPPESVALMGRITGTTLIPVTDPLVSNGGLVAIALTASMRTGTLGIDPIAPPFFEPRITSAALPLAGELRFCLVLIDCSQGLFLPLSSSAGAVGVGVGGVVTVGGTGTLRVSLFGAPYTLQTAVATAPDPNGGVLTLLSTGTIHGPLSFTTSFGLPFGSSAGTLAVVTPLRVESFPGSGGNQLPGFTRLELRFGPEPVGALPLVSAAAVLLVLGRRRLRSRNPRC